MSPFYETKQNRKNEKEIAAIAAKHFGWTAHHGKRGAYIDVMFKDGDRVAALAEVKQREYLQNDFQTYMIDTAKVNFGAALAKRHKAPFYIIVRWLDNISYIEPAVAKLTHYALGGRTDRGDANDIDKVTHYPVDQFTHIIEGYKLKELDKIYKKHEKAILYFYETGIWTIGGEGTRKLLQRSG